MRSPSNPLPPGADRWALVNDVAVTTGKRVETILAWCRKGLFHIATLAGGYGGTWVAVAEHGWPVDGPGIAAYRAQRQVQARLGTQASIAARRARRQKPARAARRTAR